VDTRRVRAGPDTPDEVTCIPADGAGLDANRVPLDEAQFRAAFAACQAGLDELSMVSSTTLWQFLNTIYSDDLGGSQVGSQQPQTWSDTQPRLAIVATGEGHTRLHRAPRGDELGLIWVAGGRWFESRHPNWSELYFEYCDKPVRGSVVPLGVAACR
jgi:hypothetical protein